MRTKPFVVVSIKCGPLLKESKEHKAICLTVTAVSWLKISAIIRVTTAPKEHKLSKQGKQKQQKKQKHRAKAETRQND